MHKTIITRLILESKEKQRLELTFSDYQTSWNFVSSYIFENNIKNRLKIHHATYSKVRGIVPDLPSGLVQEARNDCIAKYKSIKSNNHKITGAPKLHNIAIRYDKRSLSFKNNQFSIAVSGGKRIKGTFQTYKFLDKHMHYPMFAPLIFKKDGEFWIGFTFNVPESPSTGEGIVGVDLGQRRIAFTSENVKIPATELNKLRRRTRFLRSALQRKGTKSAKRKLKRIRRREYRQSRDVVHRAVNQVLQTSANIIAIEDLHFKPKKYRKGANRRRNAVPFAEFRRILEYKAPLVGKRVVAVNPFRTSLEDHRGLPDGKRQGCRYLASDGKQFDADFNAACNIRNKVLRNIPASEVPSGQVVVNQLIVDGSHSQAAPL